MTEYEALVAHVSEMRFELTIQGENNGKPVRVFSGFGCEARIVFGFDRKWGVVVNHCGQIFDENNEAAALDWAQTAIRSRLIARINNAAKLEADIEDLLDDITKKRRSSAKTHDLKIDPQPMTDILSAMKTSELRKDDRGYVVGDLVHLRSADGRKALREITHIQRGYGLPDDLCILSYRR